MSRPDPLTQDTDIDVAGLLTALRRRWWVILLITIITGVGLFLLLSSIAPKYSSYGEILLSKDTSAASKLIQDGGASGSEGSFDELKIQTEVAILSSDKLAQEVINVLRMDRLKEYNGDDATPAPTPASTEQGSDVKPPQVNSIAVRKFLDNLTIYSLEKSRVIHIEFSSTDPVLARDVVATIIDLYRQSKVNASQANVSTASDIINPRITELRALIAKERQDIVRFESENQIFKTNSGSLVNQELSEASTELSRLRAQRTAAQAKIASIRAALKSGSSLDVIPEVLNSAYIQGLRQNEMSLKAQISDMSTSLLPGHPKMKALQSQLSRYESQIRTATQNIIASLEDNVTLTRTAEKQLSNEIDTLKNEQLKINSLMVQLDATKKQISSYESELDKRVADSQRVSNRSKLTPASVIVISDAFIPAKHYFPKVIPFTLAGMVAAFVFTSVLIVTINLITTVGAYAKSASNSQQRAEPARGNDLQQDPSTHASPSGRASNNTNGNNAVDMNRFENMMLDDMDAKSGGHSANANHGSQYQGAENETIAARYAASVMLDMGRGRIIVVSPGGSKGSQTAWTLTRLLSNSRRKVVTIDVSGDSGTTNEMLGTKDVPGLLNLVTGSCTIDQVLFQDQHSNAFIIPAGAVFHAAQMPDIVTMSNAVDAIASSYDFCVIDVGDADLDEIDMVATDDTIIVISGINTDEEECARLERDLKSDGFKDILHIVPDGLDDEKLTKAAA